MNRRSRFVSLAVAPTLLFLMLFEVSIDPQLVFPHEAQQPDPAQERAYANCVEQFRRRALGAAHAETDNPEVHSTMQRIAATEAPLECRRQFPEKLVPVSMPFRFNLLDLRFRY